MEEHKPPPTTILERLASPCPPPPASGKRRSDGDIGASHSKIRAVARDLRPHFLQILRTPDFRNCEAAHEIREKIKLVLEIQQQTAESVAKKTIENSSLPRSVESQLNKQGRDLHGCAKKTEQSRKDEDQQNEDGISSTFIVGGSAFGWNFITYNGNKPVYRGVTKEAFRATMKGSTLPDSSAPKQ